MKDIVFINPPHPELVEPAAQAPLGILYLAAITERAGLDTAVVNLAGVERARTLSKIPASRVYGITGTFLDVNAVNALASDLALFATERPRIVVGGPIALSASRLAPGIEVFFGEAEAAIVGLVTGNQPVAAEELPLDAIPFPARHLWAGPFGGDVFIGRRNYFGGGSTTLLTSRGCPMRCAFCAGPALCSRKVRTRTGADVVEEMELCATDYGVRQFRLSDEYFTASQAHVEDVCRAIAGSRILGGGTRCAWRTSIGVRPNHVDTFRVMAAAGCKEVSIGVESADPEVLALICGAKVNPEDTRACLAATKAAGLGRRVLMMIGTPGTRPETFEHNGRFLTRGDFDWLALTVFQPIPGSDIAANPQKYGCRLLRDPQSLCLYGPGGENELAASIEVDGLPPDVMNAQIRETVKLAQQTGKLGSG